MFREVTEVPESYKCGQNVEFYARTIGAYGYYWV